MSNANAFKDGIKVLTGTAVEMTESQEATYMSSLDNWVLVHATRYMPLKNEQGQLYIPSTAMATKFEIPRSTVHFTLNHIVGNHGYGSWDNADVLILAPYKKAAEINGKPVEISVADTYFSTSVTNGMVLPDGTRIVRPVYDLPDGKLFEVRGNETVYKTMDFTDDEVQMLFSRLSRMSQRLYEEYVKCDFSDEEVKVIVDSLGTTGKKFYEYANDKKAFLSGVYENSRQAILGLAVREMAMVETMKSMGRRAMRCTSEMGEVATQVAKVANAIGVQGNISNKGHSNSVYYEIESVWKWHDTVMNSNWFFGDGLTMLLDKEKPLDEIYNYMAKYVNSEHDVKPYLRALIDGKLLGLKKRCMDILEKDGGIKDDNLLKVIDKWTVQAELEFGKFQRKIQSLPGYQEFLEKLNRLQSEVVHQSLRGGRE